LQDDVESSQNAYNPPIVGTVGCPSIDTKLSRPTSESSDTISPRLPGDTVKIRAILEIKKTQGGVDAQVLVELKSSQMEIVLQLANVDWQELQDWDIKELIDQNTYQLANSLSGIKGATGRLIFAKELGEVIQSPKDHEVLLSGGNILA
jgi:hypothetical protein